MTILMCTECDGEAHGCGACNGSGNLTCEARGCTEAAVAFNDEGEALCEDCLFEWMAEAEHAA